MKSTAEIIAFRLDKSNEAIREAQLLWEAQFLNTVASRLYYAAFYAVSALLYNEEVEVRTHSGQKNKFNELFIKTGKLDVTTGTIYNELFMYRQESDYKDFVQFKAAEIEPLIMQTQEFVATVQAFIEKSAS